MFNEFPKLSSWVAWYRRIRRDWLLYELEAELPDDGTFGPRLLTLDDTKKINENLWFIIYKYKNIHI